MFRHLFIISIMLLFALSACAGLENGTGESTTNSTQSSDAEQREYTNGAARTDEIKSSDSTTTENAVGDTGGVPQSDASDSVEPATTSSDSDTITEGGSEEQGSEESTNEEPGNESTIPGY